MRRVFPPNAIPKAVSRQFLPHPGGRGRAKLLHKKALSSYLFFFLVLLITLAGLDARFPGVLGFATDIASDDIVAFTNEERSKHNLSPLKLDPQLAQAAEAKAHDMFLDGYWAHVAPDGTEPWDFVDEAGYVYLSAGENLAKDFNHSSSVVRAWMKSPSHRDNILSSKFGDIGVAVVDGELSGFETTLVVQMFGRSEVSYLASVGGGASAEAPEAAQTPSARGVETETELEEAGPRPLIRTQALAQVPGPGETPGLDLKNFTLSTGFLFGAFLILLLLLDVVVVSRKRGIRFTHRSLIHLAILIFLLIGVWYSQVGTIL